MSGYAIMLLLKPNPKRSAGNLAEFIDTPYICIGDDYLQVLVNMPENSFVSYKFEEIEHIIVEPLGSMDLYLAEMLIAKGIKCDLLGYKKIEEKPK